MSLTRQHTQEDLCCAYISAVAAKAGYNLIGPQKHDYGLDIEIGIVNNFRHRRYDLGYRLHIQAKASYNFVVSNDNGWIIYDLNARAYDMLIQKDRLIPAILVLYCMPENDGEWLSIDENATTMRYCGYWKSLRGMQPSSNQATVRITIPTEQRFTESSLRSIMTGIRGGSFP